MRRKETARPASPSGQAVAHTTDVPEVLRPALDEERHLMMGAERTSETRFRTLFEQAPFAMQIFAPDGRSLQVNAAYTKLWGLTNEQLSDFNVLTDETLLATELMPCIRRAFAGQQTVLPLYRFGEPFVPTGPDVPERWIREWYYPVKDEAGALSEVIAIFEDVTESVQAHELLEQRVAERTHELSALLNVSHNVASTLELPSLLSLTLDQLRTVVDYTAAAILTMHGDTHTIMEYRGPLSREDMVGQHVVLAHDAHEHLARDNHAPVIVDDLQDNAAIIATHASTDNALPFTDARSLMVVPLLLKDRMIGSLLLSHQEPRHYTEQHATLALAIANQAAVAIENARLYEQAQEVATLKERQRLARELHDSVSQALYGIALGARTARTLLDRDASKAAAPLEYVLTLAEAGLAEMRALIFELLPAALETEGVVAALDKRVAATQARYGITIDAALGTEPEVSIVVKEAIYRIAQEALHNTVKHAHARHVTVRLDRDADGLLLLHVTDDGVGFNPGDSFPGHLGLRTMRERAVGLGGTLEVDSAPGRGTRIQVRIPCPTSV